LLGLDPEPFIEREKHTTIKPLWDLWRSVTQDFFGTASFAVVANETYTRGLRNFLEEEMGLPCTLAVPARLAARRTTRRCATAIRQKAAAGHVRQLQRAHVPGGSRREGDYIPASFPGAIIRRHTGTPFMGYSGAVYIVQEVCNALFDALFNILPLATDLDRIEATPARIESELPWNDEAQALLDEVLATSPVLVRISAARRMRDAAERSARGAGADCVTATCVEKARRLIFEGSAT
jgi:3,8-divinyl chlorophyllide a/chlorophyllide a reductase subunit Z